MFRSIGAYTKDVEIKGGSSRQRLSDRLPGTNQASPQPTSAHEVSFELQIANFNTSWRFPLRLPESACSPAQVDLRRIHDCPHLLHNGMKTRQFSDTPPQIFCACFHLRAGSFDSAK